jgi:uncharacterized protein
LSPHHAINLNPNSLPQLITLHNTLSTAYNSTLRSEHLNIHDSMPPFSNISRRILGYFSTKSHSTFASVDSQDSSNPTLCGRQHDNNLKDPGYPLLNPEKLGIPLHHRQMFRGVNMAVMEYLSGSTSNATHDYEHIQRVVMLAHKIYEAHKDDHWARDIDANVLYIACMVHQVGNTKYHVREKGDERDQEDIVRDFLKANGCKDPRIYSGAAFVAVRVSYARELEEPEQIKADADNYPALRIVQDAVRLDGLGAIGIECCLVSGVVDKQGKTGAKQSGIELHYDDFHKYLELMKTEKGGEMAKERLAFMDKFREHWFKETECSSVL